MPTLLSVLALIAAAALAPPSGTHTVVVDAADELHLTDSTHLGAEADYVDTATEAGQLDLAALTADWEDGP